MEKFVDLLGTGGYPTYEWDLASAVMRFGHHLSIVRDGSHAILDNHKSGDIAKGRNIPENRRNIREIPKITGLNSRINTDLHIGEIEAGASPNALQVRKRQSEQIPFAALERWGGNLRGLLERQRQMA